MKVAVSAIAILMMLLTSGDGKDEYGVVAGGGSMSELYLPTNDAREAAHLEHEIASGRFLKEYIKRYPQASVIQGRITVKITLPEVEENHQEEDLYLLGYFFSVQGADAKISDAYKKAVFRYIDLRTKGFTYQYAVDLIFLSDAGLNVSEYAKAIYREFPDADPRKLVLASEKQHPGWHQKTYKIKDGDFEWVYYMEIQSGGKTAVFQTRTKSTGTVSGESEKGVPSRGGKPPVPIEGK